MNKKKVVSISVLIVILFFFFYYIYRHFSDFKQLEFVNPLYLIPLILFLIISVYTSGLITKYLLQPFNINLKFKEHFGLSMVTSFYNTITPFKGGMAARAIYLKKKHQFSYTHFLATLYGIYVVSFLIASFLGLVSLYFLYTKRAIFNPLITLIFAALFIPLLILVLFSPQFPETKYKLINNFIKIANGWNIIRKNKKIVLLVSFVTLIQFFFGVLGNIISYGIFGISLGIPESLFLSAVGSLIILIAITPGSLGIAEAVAVFSGLVIGIQPAQSLSVAILNRVISTVVILTLGPIFSYYLIKKTDKKSEKNYPARSL